MKKQKPNYQLKLQLFLYAAFVFLQSLHFFGGVMVPFLTAWGGISFTQMMFLQAWFSFWLFVAEIPTGAVADFFGRKYSLMLSSLLSTLSLLVYASRPGFATFLFGEFAFAIAMSLTSGADEALLYDSIKQHQQQNKAKKMIGLMHSVHLAAMLIASPVGSYVAKHWALNMPLALTAIPMFLSLFFAGALKEPRRFEKKSESLRYWQVLLEGSSFFFRHKKFLAMILEGIIVASAAHFVVWLHQPLLAEAGLSLEYFGWVNAAMIVVEMIVSAHFVWFDKVLAKFKITYANFSFWLTLMAFVVALLTHQIWTLIIFVLLAGGFGYTRLSYLSASLHQHIPSSKRATVISSLSMIRRFFQMILDPLIGFLMDQQLRWAIIFIIVYLLITKILIKFFLPQPKLAEQGL